MAKGKNKKTTTEQNTTTLYSTQSLAPDGDLGGGGGTGTSTPEIALEGRTVRAGGSRLNVDLAMEVEKAYRNLQLGEAVLQDPGALEVSINGGAFESLQSSAIANWVTLGGSQAMDMAVDVSASAQAAGQTIEHLTFRSDTTIEAVATDPNSSGTQSTLRIKFEVEVEPEAIEAAQKYTSWFTYDNENRVVIDGGTLNNGQIELGEGNYLTYDVDGRLQGMVSGGGHSATYNTYDGMGNLIKVEKASLGDTDTFDVNQSLLGQYQDKWYTFVEHKYDVYGQKQTSYDYYGNVTRSVTYQNSTYHIEMKNAKRQMTVNQYDLDGRLIQANTSGISSGEELEGVIKSHWADLGVNRAFKSIEDKVGYDFDSRALSKIQYRFVELGNMMSYTIDNYQADKDKSWHHEWESSQSSSISYLKAMSYLEQKVLGTGLIDKGSFNPSKTISYYDANGDRLAVEEIKLNDKYERDENQKVKVRYFNYNQQGQVVKKQLVERDWAISDSDTPTEQENIKHKTISHHLYAGGQYLGEVKGDGTDTIKSQHFSVDKAGETGGMMKYTVTGGETMESLAEQMYGNRNLWYVIADANGLTGDPSSALTGGITLDMPSMASTRSNDFSSFKPQNLSAIIGDTTPSLSYVPPIPEINMFAVIVVAVISAIVTYYAGPVVGNMASQMLGNALGTQDGFDAGSFAGAVAMQGVSAWMGAGQDYQVTDGTANKNLFTEVDQATQTYTLNALGSSVVAGTGMVVGAGVNNLLKEKTNFSWRGLAANMATAYISHDMGVNSNLGGKPDSGSFTTDFFGGIGKAYMNHGFKLLLGDGNSHVDFRSVAADAFGNALGNAIVAASIPKPNPDNGKFSPIDGYENNDQYLERLARETKAQKALDKSIDDAGVFIDNMFANVRVDENGVPGGTSDAIKAAPDNSAIKVAQVKAQTEGAENVTAEVAASVPAFAQMQITPSSHQAFTNKSSLDINGFVILDPAQVGIKGMKNGKADILGVLPLDPDLMTDIGANISFNGPSILMDEIHFEVNLGFHENGSYKIFARGNINKDNIFEISHYEAYSQDNSRYEYVIGIDSIGAFKKRAGGFSNIADIYFGDMLVSRKSLTFMEEPTLSNGLDFIVTTFKEEWTNPEKVFNSLIAMAPSGFFLKRVTPKGGGAGKVKARPGTDAASHEKLKAAYRASDPNYVAPSALNTKAAPPVNLEKIYVPKDKDGNLIPLAMDDRNVIVFPLKEAEGRAHTALGGKKSARAGEYRQSATFMEGNDIPWGRVDWSDHGLPATHSMVHIHPLKAILNKFGQITEWQQGVAIPFRGH